MTKKKTPGKTTGSRSVTVRVKTAKFRKTSSTRWLERQLNDPYVALAKKEGYRSRAAFKLIELDDKFHFLSPGKKVIDLGAAPGGWTQVAATRVKAGISRGGRVIGIDFRTIDPINGAELIIQDFMEEDAPQKLKTLLNGKADIVLSDMAPNASGHAPTDHLRIMMLCEAACEFALEVLAEGGVFVAKVLQGGTEKELLATLKKHFTSVKHAKPEASRKDSAETYVVATGFKP